MAQLREFSFDGHLKVLGMEELLWMATLERPEAGLRAILESFEDDEKGEQDRLLCERRISIYK